MDFTVNNSSWLSTSSDTFKIPTEEPNGGKKTKKKIKLAVINCLKCRDLIKEKHLYAIGENYWHKYCVKCDICLIQLEDSGFLIDNTLLCRMCYNQSSHATKCFGCKHPIQTHEVVMYALNQPYHLSCFKCNYCKTLLSKGDKFVFHDGFLICKQDYESGVYINSLSSQLLKQQSFKSDNPSESNGIRRKTKISSDQRLYLESYYLKNSSPSIKQRAYIAEELNLPVKVIQTWFCNYRTKMKMQRNNELKLLSDKLHLSDHDDRCGGGGGVSASKVKRMLHLQQQQQQCFTPDQDCGTTCQISQSTEDHASPQDLSSDLSGGCGGIMYAPYSHNHDDGGGSGSGGSAGNDAGAGGTMLTYADLSNSCVKSIDRSIMAGFSGNDSNPSKACLTW